MPPQERARDVVFDALLNACGLPLMGLTKSEGGRVAAAKRDIVAAMAGADAGVIAVEIHARAGRMRAAWGDRATVTPTAIAANWSQFGGGAAKKEGAASTVQGCPERYAEAWEALFGGEMTPWAMLGVGQQEAVIAWLKEEHA